MKVVVSDTSPINYRILIGCIDLLRQLYVRIVIPVEVLSELTADGAQPQVSAWVRGRPDWVEVRTVPFGSAVRSTPGSVGLDAGEQAAIRLALAEREVLLLIDDAAGRSAASQLAFPTREPWAF